MWVVEHLGVGGAPLCLETNIMDLALVILAAASPFITLAWWVNNEDKRYHERKMKQLEIERLRQEALNSTRKTMDNLAK